MKQWTMPQIGIEKFVPSEYVALCITPGNMPGFTCGEGLKYDEGYPGKTSSSDNPWYVVDISRDSNGNGVVESNERQGSFYLGHWGPCTAHGNSSTKLTPGFITWSNDGDASQHQVYYWHDGSYHVVDRTWAENEMQSGSSQVITNHS